MKVAIVNDHPNTIYEIIKVICNFSEHIIVWTASNGQEACEKCSKETPDVIFMDLFMPVMDGVEATRQIMAQNQCTIIVTTKSLKEDTGMVYKAMGYGAVDVIIVPEEEGEYADVFSEDLKNKIEKIGILLGSTRDNYASVDERIKHVPQLLLIGASTGGPLAISKILGSMPANFNKAIVIVQHVDKNFVFSFAQWLSSYTPLPVEIACEGCVPMPGVVYVAGTNDHLALSDKFAFKYHSKPDNLPYRPSIDVLFNSATSWPKKSVAVLLTGMGDDGARGLKNLQAAGWQTLTEDKSSCIVYGMPKAAVEMHAASQVCSLEQMHEAIINHFTYLDKIARKQ